MSDENEILFYYERERLAVYWSAIRLRDEQQQREAHLAGESESLDSQCLTCQVFIYMVLSWGNWPRD